MFHDISIPSVMLSRLRALPKGAAPLAGAADGGAAAFIKGFRVPDEGAGGAAAAGSAAGAGALCSGTCGRGAGANDG